MTEQELATAFKKMQARYDEVTHDFLVKCGQQIKEIGQLTSVSINRMAELRKAGVSVSQIKSELAEVTNLSKLEILEIFKQVSNDYYNSLEIAPFIADQDATKEQLNRVIAGIYEQTAGMMDNYSNTTSISERYQEAISTAIEQVLQGGGSYNEAIEGVLMKTGRIGISVVYESGYERRIDSAVRQNVTDGVKQIQQGMALQLGQDLQTDGVELSAHPLSAKDHEAIQGRQFTNEEYAKMQTGRPFKDVDGHRYAPIKRPIGEWNCRHFAHPIIIGVSKRQYTDEQLNKWNTRNNNGMEIGGKKMSLYEITQLMREIETSIRHQKDIATIAKASGNEQLKRKCDEKIRKLNAYYKAIANKSGLLQQNDRTDVYGYSSR